MDLFCAFEIYMLIFYNSKFYNFIMIFYNRVQFKSETIDAIDKLVKLSKSIEIEPEIKKGIHKGHHLE